MASPDVENSREDPGTQVSGARKDGVVSSSLIDSHLNSCALHSGPMKILVDGLCVEDVSIHEWT